MEITCCNKINTHLKWFALKGNCINCSIVQFLVLQRIAGPFPAASHNLKHLTYFMKSVRVCGCSWREAPAVITGGLTDFIYSLGSFYNCPCCSPFAALKANAKFNVSIQEFDHNWSTFGKLLHSAAVRLLQKWFTARVFNFLSLSRGLKRTFVKPFTENLLISHLRRSSHLLRLIMGYNEVSPLWINQYKKNDSDYVLISDITFWKELALWPPQRYFFMLIMSQVGYWFQMAPGWKKAL